MLAKLARALAIFDLGPHPHPHSTAGPVHTPQLPISTYGGSVGLVHGF